MKVFCVCRSNEDKIQRPLQSTVVLSVAFFFVFSTFMSIQSLQNSLNMDDGLGVKSLSCLYSTTVVSSLLSPTFIKVLGGKLTVISAFCCQGIYTLSNFYPRFYTLIPSSLLLGITYGPFWTAQNMYITASASRIAEKRQKSLIHILDKHNGIFYSILGIAFASGSLVSSLIFRKEVTLRNDNSTQICGAYEFDNTDLNISNSSIIVSVQMKPTSDVLYQLFSVYLIFDVIGIIITIVFLPALPVSDWVKKKNVRKSIYSMFSALLDKRLLLFIPMPVAVFIQRLVLFADFTRAYVTCSFGIGMVGFVMASYALANTVSLQIIPAIIRCTRRQILVAIATLTNLLEMILWLFWNPSIHQLPLVFLSAIGWGITDSIWRLEIFGVAPLLFADKKEPAFANLHFWRSLMAMVYFALASYLHIFTKLVICISVLTIAMTLYTILEFMKKNNKRENQIVVNEQIIQGDEESLKLNNKN